MPTRKKAVRRRPASASGSACLHVTPVQAAPPKHFTQYTIQNLTIQKIVAK